MKNNVAKQAYISAIVSICIAFCFFFGPAYQIMSVENPDVKIWQSCFSLAFNLKMNGTNIERFANYKNGIGEICYGELFNVLFLILLLIGLIAYVIYLYYDVKKVKKSNFFINCGLLAISIVCLVLTFCSKAFVVGLADKRFTINSSTETKLSLGWGAILAGISLGVSVFSLAVALITSLMKNIKTEIKKYHNSSFLDNIDEVDEDDSSSSLFSGFFKKGQNPLLDLNNVEKTKENKVKISKEEQLKIDQDKQISVEKRLALLKTMKEKELITDEEYNKRKEEIIKEI